MRCIHSRVQFAEERDFAAEDSKIEKLGFESIVEVGGIVGNFVHPINELRFERRALIEKIFGELRMLLGGIVARMLDDTFANLECEIQSGKIEVAVLELHDDAERVQVVIKEAPMCIHEFVELAFASVAKGRMADIVNERESLGKFGVQAECRSDGAGDLRDFERVRQAIPEMVGKTRGEDLRFGFETAESAGMNDAVAVARVVTAIGMRGL